MSIFDRDRNAGLTKLFSDEEIADQKVGQLSAKAQQRRSATGKKDHEIEASYQESCLRPDARYKHRHKGETRPPKRKLSTLKVDKIEIKNGKRIIKLVPKSKG